MDLTTFPIPRRVVTMKTTSLSVGVPILRTSMAVSIGQRQPRYCAQRNLSSIPRQFPPHCIKIISAVGDGYPSYPYRALPTRLGVNSRVVAAAMKIGFSGRVVRLSCSFLLQGHRVPEPL
jgi:hypothetical protein